MKAYALLAYEALIVVLAIVQRSLCQSVNRILANVATLLLLFWGVTAISLTTKQPRAIWITYLMS